LKLKRKRHNVQVCRFAVAALTEMNLKKVLTESQQTSSEAPPGLCHHIKMILCGTFVKLIQQSYDLRQDTLWGQVVQHAHLAQTALPGGGNVPVARLFHVAPVERFSPVIETKSKHRERMVRIPPLHDGLSWQH
jgi:hypothetical protein